ncbi:hypothetical protein V2J09_003513 [Rumex salicifolius]
MANENLKVETLAQTLESSDLTQLEPDTSELSTDTTISDFMTREFTSSSTESSSSRRFSCPPLLPNWPIAGAALPKPVYPNSDLKKQLNSDISEMEMMKERFAKLLLGEDMSGGGKGVCSALAISNAITNLCATIFGQLWRLEPLPHEKKLMWKREMELLLCVSEHIVELIPSWQTFADGSKFEIMTCRPRTDLFINLPAVRKLDTLLIEMLDSFKDTEFWYVDQGIVASDCDGSASYRKKLQRQQEKWWLPVPRVPPGGLEDSLRNQLEHKRDCTNQILKAAMAINSTVLADMEVPESYLDTLSKTGRACLGDMIYRYITSDNFFPDCLLDCLDLSSESTALEIANRVEAAICIWRIRVQSKSTTKPNRSTTKSSWGMVKDLVVDADKRELLAERAERLLLCLKERCPALPQTTLDSTKIQFNKDVGKSILESYSRVLESVAYNIVARIEDLLYVDDLTKCNDKLSTSGPTHSIIIHKKSSKTMQFSVPTSTATPYRASFASSNGASSPLVSSPARGSRTPFVGCDNSKPARRGLGVRRVLTNYLAGEAKVKNNGIRTEGGCSPMGPGMDKENSDPQKCLSVHHRSWSKLRPND